VFAPESLVEVLSLGTFELSRRICRQPVRQMVLEASIRPLGQRYNEGSKSQFTIYGTDMMVLEGWNAGCCCCASYLVLGWCLGSVDCNRLLFAKNESNNQLDARKHVYMVCIICPMQVHHHTNSNL